MIDDIKLPEYHPWQKEYKTIRRLKPTITGSAAFHETFARMYRIKTKDGLVDPYEYWTGQKAPITEDVECVIVETRPMLLLPPHIEPEP